MTLAVQITPTGPIAPTYAVILDTLKATMRSIYGSDIYLESDSQDGQMLAIFAQAIKDANDACIAVYNGFSPAFAQGTGLSSVVKINGIRRLVASNSEVTVTIGGVVGTIINFGQVADAVNQRWALPPTVVIPPAGTIDVTATAVDPGAIPASPGTVTKIATPTRNWQTVTNAAAATPGDPVEDDATLRQRQSVSTAIPALSVIDAIQGAIRNIPGVSRAVVYENDTDTTDANGIPEHSISPVVEGGDLTVIAQTIALYKTPGTGTFGSENVPVVDPGGIPITINFFQLDLEPIFVLTRLRALSGYLSTTGDFILASLVEWLETLDIGEDSYVNRLWAPVNLSGDAATTATGLSQTSLDALRNTYNPLAVYQARADMTAVGTYAAGTTVIAITNIADFVNHLRIAAILDDGSILYTTITAIAGSNITMANAVPAGRTIPAGNLIYIEGDITIAFNDATQGLLANMRLDVS